MNMVDITMVRVYLAEGRSDLGKVEKEDEFVVQNVQKGINSAFYKSGRYSATKEKGVHHFHYLLSKILAT